MNITTLPEGRVRRAIEDLKAGKVIIVLDDADRENEGDFLCAGQFAGPEVVNLMAVHGRGLICATITEDRARELDLPPQTGSISALHGTNFTVSVDAVEGTTTGISAADRAKTISVLCDPEAKPEALGRPGHMFPIVAHRGGLAVRRGHTEASVWLCQAAGLYPVGIICEIISEDGTMARGPELERIARAFDMHMVHVDEIAEAAKLIGD
ncbi:MAG: 3,4-dihydroxy-2-butanone-4-phosphate synthase [Spirochaetota bacterium]